MSTGIHTNSWPLLKAVVVNNFWQPVRARQIPAGRQKLVRRDVAVLDVSTNDNYPLGREGGSHRAIEHSAEEIRATVRLGVVSTSKNLSTKDRR
jgi:hypothetical protein